MASSPTLSPVLVLVALLGTAACGPLPFPIPGQDGGVDGGFSVKPELSDIQRKIFTPGCAAASCHGGTNPQSGLNLTEGNAYGSLVNQDSVYALTDNIDGGLVLVIPGNPDDSFLIHKLEKTDAELTAQGHRNHMPDRNPKLNNVAIQAIRDWISAGAQNN